MNRDPLHEAIIGLLSDCAKLVCLAGIVAMMMVIAVGVAP